jgi:nucleoside-diphosphate-sugar epimerase
VVVHLTSGSKPGVSNDNPLADFLINTIGTVHLFDACAKAGGADYVCFQRQPGIWRA